MRSGSERVIEKNTREFANIAGGLCRIKLEQLSKCRLINKIFISTDDPKVVKICEDLNQNNIIVTLRPSNLASSLASTDDLINYAASIMPNDHILWTHVTSPFINESVYDRIIATYLENLSRYDSLMTVSKLQKFLWNDNGAINYDRASERWPRTQTIDPIWVINSGVFLTHRAIYANKNDRIGDDPIFFELSEYVAFDIDWLADFHMAEALYKSGYR